MPRLVLRAFFISVCCTLCLGLLASPGLAVPDAPDDTTTAVEPLLEHLRTLDRQLGRWERQIVHPQGVGPSADELQRVEGHLRRLAPDARAAGDESVERKRQVLLRTVADLRDLLDHQYVGHEDLEKGEMSRLAKMLPKLREVLLVAPPVLPSLHAADVATKRSAATKCASALEVEAGSWLLGEIDGATWLRFDPSEEGTYRLDTRGSRTDTALRVYDSCDAAAKVLATADDGMRLQASTRFEAPADRPVYVRVESAEAGMVRLAVEKSLGTGSISGTVTGPTDGGPLGGIEVMLHDAFGGVTTTFSDSDGSYSFTALREGYYWVWSTGSSELLAAAWQDVQCGASADSCSRAEATPILVEEGVAVAGIDLALSEGGEIRGRVLDATNGQVVSNVTISIFDGKGILLKTMLTDVLGRYGAASLTTGTYHVKAEHAFYESQLFDGVACAGSCIATDGTPVSVTEGSTTPGVDFQLRPDGAMIRGRVTVDGSPGRFDNVLLFDETGNFLNSTWSGSEGRYVFGGLEAGSYRLQARTFDAVDSVWDGVHCTSAGCDLLSGNLLTLAKDEWVDDVNFDLLPFGEISGTVDDETTGLGIGSGTVDVYDFTGNFREADFVGSGFYSVGQLNPGIHYARASAFAFRTELWDDRPCLNSDCDVTTGDPISVASGQSTTAGFSLMPLGEITGTVTWSGDGSPVEDVELEVFDSEGNSALSFFSIAYTDAAGTYSIRALPPGEYFVRTRSQPYRDELFDNFPCEGPSGCDPTTGTPITVSLAATTPNVDFELDRMGRLTGTVEDAVSGLGVGQGTVSLYASDGSLVASRSLTDSDFELDGLEPGDYYLEIHGESMHVPELWENVHCYEDVCPILSGTALAVTDNTEVVVNVALEKGAVLEGTVHSSDSGALVDADVILYDAGGVGRRSTTTAVDGSWRIEGVVPGTHYLKADHAWHEQRLWNGLSCAEPCDPTTGTALSPALGGSITGLDFVLDLRGEIQVTVKDQTTRDVLANGSVDLYNATGARVASDFGGTHRFRGLEAGDYFLRASSFQHHIDRVYGQRSDCGPFCAPTDGTPITVTSGDVVEVDFPLSFGPGIVARLIDAATGRGLEAAGIDVWNRSGDLVSSAAAAEGGWLRIALPEGTYFVSTDNLSGLPEELWDDISCSDGSAYSGACDPVDGTAVTIEFGQPAPELLILLGAGDPGLFFDDFESGDFGAWSGGEVSVP